MHTPPFTFRSIRELELGPAWQRMFEERWPHYREWFLQEGDAARPSYAASARMLREHMPERWRLSFDDFVETEHAEVFEGGPGP